MSETTSNESEIRENLKRCSEETIAAAIRFQQSREPKEVPAIVLGIIERFLEPEQKTLLREGNSESVRLLEDLGIDSLLMVEIVILVEETLEISIENEELRNLRTLGDIQLYLEAKIQGIPVPQQENSYSPEALAAVMPHQAPFLFLNTASIIGHSAEGTYQIRGDEEFLEGHFKGNPVFPASLMLEALGQLAVFTLLKGESLAGQGTVDPNSIYFVSCDGVHCHKVCRPGDTLELRVHLKKVHEPIAKFEGLILRHGEKVARAEEISLTFAFESTPSAE